MWKKISSKEVFSHPRITIIEDRVELPNGMETDYIRFKENGDAVTVICRNSRGRILLQKEYSYPPNEVLFQFPGGFVPKGEDLEIGVNRELMEEANYKANKLTLLGQYLINNRRSNSRMFVYVAEDLVKESLPSDAEEDISSEWVSEDTINKLIIEGKIITYTVLAAWSLYRLKGN